MSPRAPVVVPVRLSTEWVSRFWTTTPPIYIPHTQWSLQLTIEANIPLRLAVISVDETRAVVTKCERSDGAYAFGVGGSSEREPSARQLGNPWLAIGGEPAGDTTTWKPIPLVRDITGRVREVLFALPRRDTESLRKGRWRVRHDLEGFLPFTSSALTRGVRGGRLLRPPSVQGEIRN